MDGPNGIQCYCFPGDQQHNNISTGLSLSLLSPSLPSPVLKIGRNDSMSKALHSSLALFYPNGFLISFCIKRTLDVIIQQSNVNVLTATELYIFKWLKWPILCYIHFSTIKKKKRILDELRKEKNVWTNLAIPLSFLCSSRPSKCCAFQQGFSDNQNSLYKHAVIDCLLSSLYLYQSNMLCLLVH